MIYSEAEGTLTHVICPAHECITASTGFAATLDDFRDILPFYYGLLPLISRFCYHGRFSSFSLFVGHLWHDFSFEAAGFFLIPCVASTTVMRLPAFFRAAAQGQSALGLASLIK